MLLKFLITGGAGFIGSSLVRALINDSENQVLCLDKLTYAGSLKKVESSFTSKNFKFIEGDITHQEFMSKVLDEFQPNIIFNLAAESHVDRSIAGPAEFIKTNILGTYTLLEESLKYFRSLDECSRNRFLFFQISTDEVYGDLGEDGSFLENSPYNPSSPYSASKASADHLVRAWGRTYGLPFIISHSSNNYGPYQHQEKLIPLVLSKAIKGEEIPVFGNGMNVRDWLHVEDHVRALIDLAFKGKKFESYNIGGNCEVRNIDLILKICRHLDVLIPYSQNILHEKLIKFVGDRPGHDYRYALDTQKIQNEIGWKPAVDFDEGLLETIKWYLDNQDFN